MDFYELLDHVLDLLRSRGRVSYRALKMQFNLNDEAIEALKDELIAAQQLAVDEQGTVLVWTGATAAASPPAAARAPAQERAPVAYTPPHLSEKILTARAALEGERKQVTVLFADLKDSTELIRGLDPEAAQQLLDPAIHRMMEAVHRYEGTVNQVLGDGIMALFGAPIAHEDHALRACYAALAMQAAMRAYTEQVRRTHGLEMRMRVGLNAGEVVVRAIGNDLHMDYSAVGETTHLAARIDRLAAEEKRLLQTAAVIGMEVPLPLLQAIAELPEAALHRGLAHLQAAEFLYETRLFPDHEYTFKHALTHEVAYSSVLQERRRVLHARIVAALEALAGDRVAEQVERLAQHALRGEVWDKALAYCRQAGEKAMARSAHREAVGYFEQALSALPHLPETRATREQAIDLRLALRSALNPSGDFGRVLALLREAEALAEALDDPRRLGLVSALSVSPFLLQGRV